MARKRKKQANDERTIENRKARHNYIIDHTVEVGIKLHGSEVKSVREGNVSIGEGFIRVYETPLQLKIHNITIGHYAPAAALNHDPLRTRVLLAKKPEIRRLAKAAEAKGTTIVPLKLYFKNGFAKLLIGVARGKSASDKRNTLRDREQQMEMRRAMSTKVGWGR
ncbi:MAG: SsrA-binding protein SmpB [Planctomycetota bacterium]